MIVTCKCGNRWNYKGNYKSSVVCPDCRTRIKIQMTNGLSPEPVHVKCGKCGYEWNYSGTHTVSVLCPDCRTRTFIINYTPFPTKLIPVECTKCGYSWGYSGTKTRATCPDCGYKTLTGGGTQDGKH